MSNPDATAPAPDEKVRHNLSSGATPFIPTFMRDQPQPPATPPPGPAPPTPIGHEDVPTPSRGAGGRGGRNRRRQQQQRHQRDVAVAQQAAASLLTTVAFKSLLSGMADDDVHMLMQCMPSEVQQLYDTHMTHYMRGQNGGGKNQPARSMDSEEYLSPVMSAALATFGDLTPDQLGILEDFLWQMGEEDEITAYRAREEGGGHEIYDGMDAYGEDGGIFLNDDHGLQQDEEVWLIEQMMAANAASQKEAAAKAKQAK